MINLSVFQRSRSERDDSPENALAIAEEPMDTSDVSILFTVKSI